MNIQNEDKSILICNPPINFLTNMNTHIGHLFYSTILDVSARFREKFEGKKVNFPARSYNLYGKPTERYLSEHNITLDQFKDFFYKHIENDWIFRNLNLKNNEIIIDDNEKVKSSLQETFKTLYAKGFLIIKDEEIFLDLTKLNKEEFIKGLDNINITPLKVKKDIIFLIKNNCNKPLKISRDRDYSIPSNLTNEKIAPFYIVTNFWDGYYPQSDYVLACSFNLILRSAVLRMIVKHLEKNDLGLSEIIVYPKLLGEDTKKWNIKEISKLKYAKDILRLAMMYSYTHKRHKLNATNESQKFSIKIVKKLLKVNSRIDKSTNSYQLKIPNNYAKDMRHFKYLNIIQELWDVTRHLGTQEKVDEKSFHKLLDLYYPFIPEISQNIKDCKNLDKMSEEIYEYKSLILGD